MLAGDGSVSYHCFNCHFTASWQPGRHLSYKFRQLLAWMGADDVTVKRLVIEAIRIKDTVAPEVVERVREEYVVKPRDLPAEAKTLQELAIYHEMNGWQNADQLHQAVHYLDQRKIDLVKYPFMLTPETYSNLHKRVIIPFYWKGEPIGYTARAIDDTVKPKYFSWYEPNYVFNLDQQHRDSKFVLVTEGPFDGMSIDGVSVCGSEVSEVQADIIESLGKEVIVVPDFDVKEVRGRLVWSGAGLVDAALKYGWSVSFPVWHTEFKDTAKAVEELGKLFALKAILDGKETSKLKIELLAKRIYN